MQFGKISKIVGYTCLQVPGPQTEEEKEMASGEHMPPTPPGMHAELMKEMFGFLGSAIPEGYNPETDFRKHRNEKSLHPANA